MSCSACINKMNINTGNKFKQPGGLAKTYISINKEKTVFFKKWVLLRGCNFSPQKRFLWIFKMLF